MVEFETLNSKEVKFGNNFIEVSRKKVISDKGENQFIAIARGFYLQDGTRRFKSSITLPSEDEKREEIANLIKSF